MRYKAKAIKRMNNLNFNIRITKDFRELLKEAAQHEDLLVSAWVRRVLKAEAFKVLKRNGNVTQQSQARTQNERIS